MFAAEIVEIGVEEHVRSDIAEIKVDLRAVKDSVHAFRAEMQVSISELRLEMRESNAALRADLRADIASLRTEMVAAIGGLRTELVGAISGLRTEMHLADHKLETGLRQEIGKVKDSLNGAKIWALLIAAALLGVMARGFHWI